MFIDDIESTYVSYFNFNFLLILLFFFWQISSTTSTSTTMATISVSRHPMTTKLALTLMCNLPQKWCTNKGAPGTEGKWRGRGLRHICVKGVAECGKETNTRFFFWSFAWHPPPSPYLPNIVCFLHICVFSDVFWSSNIVFDISNLHGHQENVKSLNRA